MATGRANLVAEAHWERPAGSGWAGSIAAAVVERQDRASFGRGSVGRPRLPR